MYKELFFEEKHSEETKALEKIKKDSKFFYKYVKKFKKIPSSPSILVDSSNNLITDPSEISNILQDQFKSVFNKLKSYNSIK